MKMLLEHSTVSNIYICKFLDYGEVGSLGWGGLNMFWLRCIIMVMMISNLLVLTSKWHFGPGLRTSQNLACCAKNDYMKILTILVKIFSKTWVVLYQEKDKCVILKVKLKFSLFGHEWLKTACTHWPNNTSKCQKQQPPKKSLSCEQGHR